MSKYTTGEIAKICGVSVRTVQYYDSRGILTPSELSEGGRRLYSENDLEKMKIICFLRNLGFSIKNINAIFSEENPEEIITMLIEQQESALKEEIHDNQKKLEVFKQLKQGMRIFSGDCVKSIGDVVYMMKDKKALKKLHGIMLAVGILMDVIEIAAIYVWWKTGMWEFFAVSMILVIILGIVITSAYVKNTAYICTQCHKIFKPTAKEILLAQHTPKTRKLNCPHCGYKGYCVEIYHKSTTK